MRTIRRVAVTTALAIVALGGLPAAQALAADRSDTVSTDRATVRDVPSGLVLANARHGDHVDRQSYCGQWLRVRVHPTGGHAMATETGWMIRSDLSRSARQGGLDGIPQDCGARDADRDRWTSFVGAANSPAHSLRYTSGKWHHVSYGTPVAPLTGLQCVPSFNYIRDGRGERPDPTQRVSHVDLAHPKYRYATTSGAVALVAVPSTTDQKANIWAFVPAGCVQPDRKHGYSTVYFPRVVQVDHLPDNPITSSELHKHSDKYGCHGPVRSSAAPRLGWVWDPKNKPACPV